MTRHLLIMVVVGWLVAGTAFADRHSGRILIQVEPAAVSATLGTDLRDVPASMAAQALPLPAGVKLWEPTFSSKIRAMAPERAAPSPPRLDLSRYVYASVPPGWTPERLAAELSRHPAIAVAEPDFIGEGGAAPAPNDPQFANQWYHRNTVYTNGAVPSDIRTLEAWAINPGSTNILVAVLDTGLNPSLAEFAGRTEPGYDFVNNDSDPADDHNHGCAVTAVFAANADNTNGIAGVNRGCRILPVKVLNSANNGYYSDFADGVAFAVSNGADIISFSIGGSSSSTILSNAIMDAIADGVIFITISHNDSSGSVRFPGRMTACITVGASDRNDAHATFSNYGTAVDLCAPGRYIYTISRTGATLANWYGTSFSCPLVAGVAAMVLDLRPDLTQTEMEALLCASADDGVGDAKDVPGWDPYHGWGRLNARNALLLAGAEPVLQRTAGGLTAAWSSPPNASNRTPFQVELLADPLHGEWTNVTAAGSFVYSPTQAVWTSSAIAGSPQAFVRFTARPD